MQSYFILNELQSYKIICMTFNYTIAEWRSSYTKARHSGSTHTICWEKKTRETANKINSWRRLIKDKRLSKYEDSKL